MTTIDLNTATPDEFNAAIDAIDAEVDELQNRRAKIVVARLRRISAGQSEFIGSEAKRVLAKPATLADRLEETTRLMAPKSGFDFSPIAERGREMAKERRFYHTAGDPMYPFGN